MNSITRMFKVLFSPKEVFTEVKKSPSIIIPIVILTLLTVSFTTYYASNADLPTIIEKQFESNTRLQQIPADQKDKMIEQQSKVGKYAMMFGPIVFLPLYFFIVGLYFFIASKIAGEELGYIQSVSISVYSNSVMILSTIVAFIIMFATDFTTTPLEQLMPSSLGYFFSADNVGMKLFTFFTKVEFFKIWALILSVIGLSTMTKIKTVSAALIVFIPWLIIAILPSLFV